MKAMNRSLQTYVAYKFIKLLVKPFTQWNAYKLGLIDEDGNRTEKEAKTREEEAEVGATQNLIRKVKRMIGKLPFGRTMFGSIMAASLLLKEEFNHQGKLLEEQDCFIFRDSPDAQSLTDEFIDLVFEEVCYYRDELNLGDLDTLNMTLCESLQEMNDPISKTNLKDRTKIQPGMYRLSEEFQEFFGDTIFYIKEEHDSKIIHGAELIEMTDVRGRHVTIPTDALVPMRLNEDHQKLTNQNTGKIA